MAQLICRNVAVGYGSKVVLHNIDFEVHAGNYICIAGENGSGKTTLMKTILGLQKPLKGEIHLGDGLHANEIGYLPQQTVLQKDFPACRSGDRVVRLSGNMWRLPSLLYPKRKKSVRRKLCRK